MVKVKDLLVKSMFILTGVGVPGVIWPVLALNSLQKSAERIPLAPVSFENPVNSQKDLIIQSRKAYRGQDQ